MVCHAYIHVSEKPEPGRTCETCLSRSPVLACGAARPCKQSFLLTSSHLASTLQCKVPMACHASIHLNGKPESEPTGETRLPRSPSLARKTACPCKQSQCLTLCQMPALLGGKL